MHTNSMEEQRKVAFTKKLEVELPDLPPVTQQVIVNLFDTYGSSLDLFSCAINASLECNHLAPAITQIAQGLLGPFEAGAYLQANKRAGGQFEEEPAAKRQHIEHAPFIKDLFAKQLYEDLSSIFKTDDSADEDDEVVLLNKLKEKMDCFLPLFSCGNRAVFRSAWQCLDELITTYCYEFGVWQTQQVVLIFLEQAVSFQKNLNYTVPTADQMTMASRLIALACALQECSGNELIAYALHIFSKFSGWTDSSVHISQATEQEIVCLLNLMDSKNEHVIRASIAVQNIFDWESNYPLTALFEPMKAFSIDKLYHNTVSILKPRDCNYQAIVYLKNIYSNFYDNISIAKELSALFFALAEDASPIEVFECCLFFDAMPCDFFHEAIGQKGIDCMLALLKNYNGLYEIAAKKNCISPDENRTLQNIINNLLLNLHKLQYVLIESSVQDLGNILINMLNFSDRYTVITAICKLAEFRCFSEEFTEYAQPLVLQNIPFICSILTSANSLIVDEVLVGLVKLASKISYQAPLVSPQIFDSLRNLILNPKTDFIGNALKLWSQCLKLKEHLDESDADLITGILFPALDDTYQVTRHPTLHDRYTWQVVKALSTIAPLQDFFLNHGQAAIKALCSLHKRENVPLEIAEEAYECLGNLAQPELASQLYKAGLLKDIKALWDTEDFSAGLVSSTTGCFYKIFLCIARNEVQNSLSQIQVEALTAKMRLDQMMDLISQLFGCRQPCVQRLACSLSYEITLIPNMYVGAPDHHAGALALIESEQEDIAYKAMILVEKLISIPGSHFKGPLKRAVGHVVKWLLVGNLETEQKAIALLLKMCMFRDICIEMVERGVLVALLPLISEPSLTKSGMHLVAFLSPLTRPALREYFKENVILYYLNHEDGDVKKSMVYILASIGWPSTCAQFRDSAVELIWPITAAVNNEVRLMTLSRLLSRQDIVNTVAKRLSKENFLIALDIISKQRISTPTYVSPFSNVSMHYRDWYQPNGKAPFSDVVLQVEGAGKLHCHKLILSLHCDYFKSCLLSDMQEGHADVIAIQNVRPEAFNKFIQFLYEQTYTFTTVVDAKEMLKVAQRFMAANLESACIAFLASQLNAGTVEEIYECAHYSMQLQICVMEWMINNYLHLPAALKAELEEGEAWLEFWKILSDEFAT